MIPLSEPSKTQPKNHPIGLCDRTRALFEQAHREQHAYVYLLLDTLETMAEEGIDPKKSAVELSRRAQGLHVSTPSKNADTLHLGTNGDLVVCTLSEQKDRITLIFEEKKRSPLKFTVPPSMAKQFKAVASRLRK